MKKHRLIVGLILIGFLNAADTEGPLQTDYPIELFGYTPAVQSSNDCYYIPAKDPILLFKPDNSSPNMHNRAALLSYPSGLLVIQTYCKNQDQFYSFCSTLFQEQQLFASERNEIAHQLEKLCLQHSCKQQIGKTDVFTFTWLAHNKKKSFKKSYYPSGPYMHKIKCTDNVLVQLCSLDRVMNTVSNLLEHEAPKEKSLHLDTIATYAENRLAARKDTQEAVSYIIINYKKYRESISQKKSNCILM